ncbi:MAG: murein biosynthesis integral membrane protein MurJ [Verrucomicrobia bacterium]|nr:murein biosynthesis integral membrane protein MurJ [Verrucomicrobiota bacterium]
MSRVSGLLRDIAMAFCFGSSPEIAGLLVAYRLANLFRRLLGEGNLQAGFVPQFETMRGLSFGAAAQFYREAALSMAALSGAVALGFELVLWGLLEFLSPDWREIALLTMRMVPSLLFLTLSGLNTALLQSQKKYFWPAAAPVAFNFVWIAAAFLSDGARALSIWIAGACAVQWAMTAIQVRRELGPGEGKRRLFSPEWKKMIRPMTLGLIGIGAVQINSALDAIFARIADLSGPAYLWYAIRVQQLPLALFGIALSGALLPPLSRAMQQGDMGRFRELLTSGLRNSAALMIPCTFGLFALGGAGLNLLYGHGDFSRSALYETLACLWAYGAGLVPAVFVLLMAQGFYAQKSYWIPARASLIAVGVNTALNGLFVFGFGWGAISVALATSVSAAVNGWVLAKHLGSVFDRGFVLYCFKLVLASLLPAVLVLAAQELGFGGLAFPGLGQVIQFLTLSSIYMGGVVGMSLWLQLDEIKGLLKTRI